MKIFRSVLLCSLLLLTAESCLAVDPSKQITQYAHTAWRMRDGFLNSMPIAIAQTTDGYLWIGTQSGLLRFDGVRFVPWKPAGRKELWLSSITALQGARDGSLWIGTYSGLNHLVHEELIQYPDRPGGVGDIVERANGEIWFSLYQITDEHPWGICKVVGARTQCYDAKSNGFSLAEDESGSLWTGYGAAITRWKLGSPNNYAPPRLRLGPQAGVGSLASARDGSMWVGMQSGGRGAGLQQFTNGTWKPFIAQHFDSSTLVVTALLLDRENVLWIGTDQGIYRIRGRQVDHFGSSDGLSSDVVNAMGLFEDREGNVWAATSAGLDCFSDLAVTTYSTREGLPVGEVESVLATREGTVWLGVDQTLVALRQQRTPLIEAQRAPGNQVTSLLEDHAGRLWVGVDDFLTIYKNGSFRRIDKPDGKPIGFVVGMTEDVEHNIWAETKGPPRTLFRIQDFKVQEEFPASQVPAARKVVPDPLGGIWLGLIRGDLARYQGGKLEAFPFKHIAVPGPASDVNDLLMTSDGAVLGATGFGIIAWRDGTQQTLTVRNGLPCDGINSLIEDKQRDLWLYSQCGLVEIPNAEMQKWWQKPDTVIHFRILDSMDGVLPGPAAFEASARSPDGRLWFANGNVLQMVDPAHISRNLLPPPVHIEEMIADRKSYAPENNLRLPPITRDLEIDYAGLNFSAPQKVHFRYKLEGHDLTWQEPGTRRQAFYSGLSPRKYRFRVIASNSDGVWNEAGATLDFRVMPAWYQTAWFRVICVIFVLCIAWTIYRLRVRQIARVIGARFDERLAERTRIAGELHDTLLQTIQGSKLVANDALNKHSDEVKMRGALEQLSAWLELATQESRLALNSLRSSTMLRNDLAEAFQRTTESGPAIGLLAATFSVVGNSREMHPIVRDEIYRIGYEAIRNAQAHSGGTRLEVELRYGLDLLLHVRDNGVGIDPTVSEHGKDGHFGLQGMRERAARIGAELTLASSAKSGTEIALTVPGSIAFVNAKTALGSRLRAFVRRNTRTPKSK